jgi:hypothetical protein
MVRTAPPASKGSGLTPVVASGAWPERVTPALAPTGPVAEPPDEVATPPEPPVDVLADEAVPLPPLPVVPLPAALPAVDAGDVAVALVTPHVGVVWPAATSAGVRSPHEYPFASAAVGATAPGTPLLTASMP